MNLKSSPVVGDEDVFSKSNIGITLSVGDAANGK